MAVNPHLCNRMYSTSVSQLILFFLHDIVRVTFPLRDFTIFFYATKYHTLLFFTCALKSLHSTIIQLNIW